MSGLDGNTLRSSRATALLNSSRPRGVKDDRATFHEVAAQIQDLAVSQHEIVIPGHIEDGNIDRVEFLARKRFRRVLIVIPIRETGVYIRDQVRGIGGETLPLLEDLFGPVRMDVFQFGPVLDLVHDREVCRRRRGAVLCFALAGAGIGNDAGILAAGLRSRRRLDRGRRLRLGRRKRDHTRLGENRPRGECRQDGQSGVRNHVHGTVTSIVAVGASSLGRYQPAVGVTVTDFRSLGAWPSFSGGA